MCNTSIVMLIKTSQSDTYPTVITFIYTEKPSKPNPELEAPRSL